MNNTFLLDVNLLVALAWPNHENHTFVKDWFLNTGKICWSSCPLTQAGFIRISSNPVIIESAVPPETALSLLKSLTQIGKHIFWPDCLNISDFNVVPELFQGHRQITDYYLISLAVENNGKLATLDRKLYESVKGTYFEDFVHFLNN